MRIERIETYLSEQLAVVKVTTDDGAEGFGQTAPYGAAITVHTLHDMVAPFFLGQDPWDLEPLVATCLRQQYKFPGTFINRALCGIDTALWDLLGRTTGQPVHKLLGGSVRAAVPMYASSMSRAISPQAEGERLGQLASEQGFRCAKIRIGSAMGGDVDAAPGRTEGIITHLRQAMGSDFGLHADANGGFSAAAAIRVGRLLEEHAFSHFEEPCPYQQLEQTASVAAALDIPVAGGEQDVELPQFHRMVEMGAVDIVQPDVGYIGGVARARKVAILAELAGIPCTPHCANRSLLQVFTLHLTAAMPACSQFQEWSIEATPWTDGLFAPALEVVDGEVAVPTAPGWGVEVDPGFLQRAQHQESRAGTGAVATG